MATLFTFAECEQILVNALDADKIKVKLKDFQVEPALDAIGFLGEYFRLILIYVPVDQKVSSENSVAKQVKLFVKSIPRKNSEPEKDVIFQKESNLYATILRDIQKVSVVTWSVKCHYTRDDLIVLQDLQELGYQMCTNMNESLNELEMKQILRGLAALHASSIVYEVSSDINIGEHYQHMLQEITVAPNVTWYTTGLKAVLAVIRQHPSYQSQHMQEFIRTKLETQLECVYEMMNPSTKYRNVICHRDPWRCNIFFNKTALNGDEVTSAIFVDYQTCRYCPAIIDVIFAIFMNLNQKQRKLNELYYIKWYYSNFCNDLEFFGIKAEHHISQQDLLSSYREYQLFGLIYKTIAATILEVPKEFITNDYKHVERTKKVLDYMQENANFRFHLEHCTEEIIESVLQTINEP